LEFAFMKPDISRLENGLMTVAGKLGQQPHLNAIRDGVISALPLILIGSLFMLVAQPPLPSETALTAYTAHHFVGQLLIGYQLLVGLVGLYVAFGVAHSLAKRYELDGLAAGLLSAAALLMVNGMQVAPVTKLKVIPLLNLGSSGLFVALILGLIVPEVQRLARKYQLEITMPEGVPPAVGRSFSALIPGLLVLIPLWAIVHLGGVDLFQVINNVLAARIMALCHSGTAGFVVMLVITLIDSFFWLIGVHAVAILAPLSFIWLANITANSAGQHLLNTRESFQFFIWLGGSGATVMLPFLLLRARSSSLRAVARIGLLPSLFNINEPLIFGLPVMMNATLAIPFILAPLVALTTTVIATSRGLVPVPHLIVPWTLPAPIGAFLTTGGSWQAAALSALNILLSALIYWPFVRALDRKMAEQEGESEGGKE
jgi:PTS system cellobiose-specific IIC component